MFCPKPKTFSVALPLLTGGRIQQPMKTAATKFSGAASLGWDWLKPKLLKLQAVPFGKGETGVGDRCHLC